MDDFVFILKTKSDCIAIKKKIENFLAQNLKLSLNDKSRYYPCKMGVNFCGYRIFTTHRLLRTASKKKIKRNIKKWNQKYQNHSLDIPYTLQSLTAWIGHASHCNSFHLQQKIINSCNFLISSSTDKELEKNLLDDITNYKNT